MDLMGDTRALADSRLHVVREELQRVLESTAFRSSKRCREFLHHIVEKTVNGPASGLKERTIGIELFGLPHDFDTSQHTIVRVTATETRKKLAQYYQSENASSAVKIFLPPGAYNVEFTWREVPAPLEPEDLPPPPEPVAETAETVPAAALPPPAPVSRRWLVGGGAVGLLAAASAWAWRWSAAPALREPSPAANPLHPGDQRTGAVRIGAGHANTYIDRNGNSWGVDQFFTGGNVMARPAERVFRTLDPDLYRRVRLGEFTYDIPLPPGNYELHLHFAETGLSDFISAESSGEGQRVFRISANGVTLLNFFDIVADAAATNTADERVFRNVRPAADGFLHLVFSPQRGSAVVSAIELLPVPEGKVLPVRLRSGWPTAWRDAAGDQWRADSYFLGGNALVRRTNPARESKSLEPDNALYASERWGHFSYALPVPEGRYRLTLKFCEGHLGPRNTGVGGVGSRVFDVFCNGVTLLKDFDIVKEAGGEGRPVDRVFSGLRPNAQGKILLTFVPNKGMACVNGIEVIEA